MVDVLMGKKKHLKTTKLCGKMPPDYKELCVKNCYHDIVRQCPDVLDYLPDTKSAKDPNKETLPPHSFFWTTLYTLYYDSVEEYIA